MCTRQLGDTQASKQVCGKAVMEMVQAEGKGGFVEDTWRQKGNASFVFGHEVSKLCFLLSTQ